MSIDTSLIDNPDSYRNMITTPVSIGDVEILEIFAYYDMPIQYLVRGKKVGDMYIGTMVDDSDDDETWHFLEVSHQRLMLIRNNHLDLYTAFRQSENDLVIELIIHKRIAKERNALVLSESLLNANHIPDDDLPPKGVYLYK